MTGVARACEKCCECWARRLARWLLSGDLRSIRAQEHAARDVATPQHRSRSLRRVLDEIAIRVGRAGGQGTPGKHMGRVLQALRRAKDAATAGPLH